MSLRVCYLHVFNGNTLALKQVETAR